MLGFFVIGNDKPGKDTNFRGLTIFDDTLYVTKGSGGNGVNTVYQVGPRGSLPTTSNAPGTPAEHLEFLDHAPPGIPSGFSHPTQQPRQPPVETIRSGSGSPTPPPCTFATRATWSIRRAKSSMDR